MSTRPKQRPGKSKQDYGTPPEFVRAVEAKFGKISFDLAAHVGNHLADGWWGESENSLVQDWTSLRGNLWLNPPFGKTADWARKCWESMGNGRRIILLTPASIGTKWFASYVFGTARVFALRPRITFVGEANPYPGDLMLSVYDPRLSPAFCLWRWDR